MSILDGKEISQHIPDPLIDYLIKVFDEARFDQTLPDGTMWCSDSNAVLDPHQIAKDIRELLHATAI